MLTGKSITILEIILQDYLQYLYMKYLISLRYWKELDKPNPDNRPNPDWCKYVASLETIEACGGKWYRSYHGKDKTDEELNNIKNYIHTVKLPDNNKVSKLNIDAWKY